FYAAQKPLTQTQSPSRTPQKTSALSRNPKPLPGPAKTFPAFHAAKKPLTRPAKTLVTFLFFKILFPPLND
ncbi:hypothetical protein CEV08_08820, partial [Bartonella tribocorum]